MRTRVSLFRWDKTPRPYLSLKWLAALAVLSCSASATPPATSAPHDTASPSVTSTAPPSPTTAPDAEQAARARFDAIRATECFSEPLLQWGGLDSETSPRVDREATPEEQRELTRLAAIVADEHAADEARREALGQQVQLFHAMSNWPRIARTSFEYALRTRGDIEFAVGYYARAVENLRWLGRVRCEQHLLDHVGELHALHCVPPTRKAEQCEQLDDLFVVARVSRIIEQVARADKTNDGDGYRAAAEDYMGFLAAHCEPKAEPHYDRCEEVAYNAGTLFLITQQKDRAKAMLDYLQDPKNGLRDTLLAKLFPCRYEDRPMSECEGRR